MPATSGQRSGRWNTAEVDLEDLAAGYRHRDASPAALERAARATEGLAPGAWALDVGGGRGEQAGTWVRRGVNAVVLDPSETMVREASAVPGVHAVRGTAQAVAFATSVFSLVWFHLSLQYGDWRAAATEALRVLRPGGNLAIWTLGPDHHRSSMLATWFPSVAHLDVARFPEPALVEEYLFERATSVHRSREVETVERTAASWERAVSARFVGTLQLIGPEELEDGLRRFRAAHPDPSEVLSYQLIYDCIVAIA